MHLRMIVKQFGLRYTRLYETLELIYMATYMISRGIFIPFTLVIDCVKAELCPIIVKVICVGLFLQSVFYIFEMFKILKRKQKQLKERSKAKISYFWLSENPQIKSLSYMNRENKDKIFWKKLRKLTY